MMRILALALACVALAGCDNDASVASRNISQAADNFQINRRIVFYNIWKGEVVLSIEGLCSQEPSSDRIAIICKVGANDYKKHFLGYSTNVTYFSEQLEPAKAGVYRYVVTFKPSALIPSVDVR